VNSAGVIVIGPFVVLGSEYQVGVETAADTGDTGIAPSAIRTIINAAKILYPIELKDFILPLFEKKNLAAKIYEKCTRAAHGCIFLVREYFFLHRLSAISLS